MKEGQLATSHSPVIASNTYINAVPYVPDGIDTWFEPFAGSAAMTIWAAHGKIAKRYVIADSLEPIAFLWRDIIVHADKTAARYGEIWHGQKSGDVHYFNEVRIDITQKRSD